MNRKKKEKGAFTIPMIGANSLLVIFAVLCITVFALLSVSAVNAETSLSKKTAEVVEAYYNADCEAEEILAKLRTGEVTARSIKQEGNNTYSYTCKISDTQALEVEVIIDGEQFQVIKKQAVYTGEWEPDDSLNVWEGN